MRRQTHRSPPNKHRVNDINFIYKFSIRCCLLVRSILNKQVIINSVLFVYSTVILYLYHIHFSVDKTQKRLSLQEEMCCILLHFFGITLLVLHDTNWFINKEELYGNNNVILKLNMSYSYRTLRNSRRLLVCPLIIRAFRSQYGNNCIRHVYKN